MHALVVMYCTVSCLLIYPLLLLLLTHLYQLLALRPTRPNGARNLTLLPQLFAVKHQRNWRGSQHQANGCSYCRGDGVPQVRVHGCRKEREDAGEDVARKALCSLCRGAWWALDTEVQY